MRSAVSVISFKACDWVCALTAPLTSTAPIIAPIMKSAWRTIWLSIIRVLLMANSPEGGTASVHVPVPFVKMLRAAVASLLGLKFGLRCRKPADLTHHIGVGKLGNLPLSIRRFKQLLPVQDREVLHSFLLGGKGWVRKPTFWCAKRSLLVWLWG